MTKMNDEKTFSLTHHYYFSPSSSSSVLVCIVVHLLFCLICSSVTLHASTTLYSNETDRNALLDFKDGISYDPLGVLLNSWNDSEHHCHWQGVSCGRRHQRVVALRLLEKGLVGTITPHIGNLTFLRDINLGGNGLYGRIPRQIGGLFRLRYLNLSFNTLSGELAAVNLSSCSELREIYFVENGLQGEIPPSLASLKKLQYLNLAKNQFTGRIPQAFGNLSSLQALFLRVNHLEGSIPNEITECRGLRILSLGANNLSGTLSPAFFNMTSITTFAVTGNSLEGTIPSYIGDTMPNLEGMYFADNKFHGTIPLSFPNASKLLQLGVSHNYFEGKVPENIGKLKHLLYLNLERNLLGDHDDLAFIPSLSNCSNLQVFSIAGNRFQGKLPNTIANLSSKLFCLDLGGNKISGTIPSGIKGLVSLTMLVLGDNLLSGVIPSGLGELQKLQGLALYQNNFSGEIPSTLYNLTSLAILDIQNNFSGEIPSTLYNLTSLAILDIHSNNLVGSIPPDVANFWNLNQMDMSHNKLNGSIPDQIFDLPALSVILNLSHNSFTGPLSPAVGKLKTLNLLDISMNQFSGEIPESLGDCLSLGYVDMHANRLEGKLSPLVSLKSIWYLDLSNNKLSGEIPRVLQNLHFLQYLNLSFNDLEGEVPRIGIFATEQNVSLLGNKKLCGGVLELKLPPCFVEMTKHKKHLKLMLLVIFTCLSIIVALSFLAFRRKDDRRREFGKLSKVEKLSKIPYTDLHRATEGFSHTNLIGSGSFGSVYKGRFQEQTFAVKVLDLLNNDNGASKSFVAECKILKNIRHRNLVPILTCCSSCDSAGNEFKALVYEFMENGDLHTWLHSNSAILSVLQRLNIAIDIASALYYLHDDCEPPVIHCDLKPSNILLDKDLIAHVGDFGLSKLLYNEQDSSGEQTSTVQLNGSIGYIPPEYGVGVKASTFGDIYSYGILLLEMFTAKRPTDYSLGDECSSLYEYVETALPEQVMKIVDPLLLPYLDTNHQIRSDEELGGYDGNLVEIEESKMHSFFLSIFKIGLLCASTSPLDRKHMKDVNTELLKIKKVFFI